MKFSKLRIAWSVACGIACVLLIALWVRSYWRLDEFHVTSKARLTRVTSNYGKLQFATETDLVSGPYGNNSGIVLGDYVESWGLWHQDALANAILPPMPQYSWFGFSYSRVVDSVAIVMPTWSVVLIFAILSTATWTAHLGRRFSLRTFMIATTLVAVALGLIAWSMP